MESRSEPPAPATADEIQPPGSPAAAKGSLGQEESVTTKGTGSAALSEPPPTPPSAETVSETTPACNKPDASEASSSSQDPSLPETLDPPQTNPAKIPNPHAHAQPQPRKQKAPPADLAPQAQAQMRPTAGDHQEFLALLQKKGSEVPGAPEQQAPSQHKGIVGGGRGGGGGGGGPPVMKLSDYMQAQAAMKRSTQTQQAGKELNESECPAAAAAEIPVAVAGALQEKDRQFFGEFFEDHQTKRDSALAPRNPLSPGRGKSSPRSPGKVVQHLGPRKGAELPHSCVVAEGPSPILGPGGPQFSVLLPTSPPPPLASSAPPLESSVRSSSSTSSWWSPGNWDVELGEGRAAVAPLLDRLYQRFPPRSFMGRLVHTAANCYVYMTNWRVVCVILVTFIMFLLYALEEEYMASYEK